MMKGEGDDGDDHQGDADDHEVNLEVVVFMVSTAAEVEAATHPEEEDHGGVEDLHQPGCAPVGGG